MKHRKQDKKSGMILAGACAVGVAAVAVTTFAAYRSTIKNMVQTGSDPTSSWSLPAVDSDVPVQNNVPDVPKDVPAIAPDTSSSTPEESEPAEEANKPVNITVGNIMPVEGEISHPFSNGELVKSETLGVWKTHDGIDILCEPGTEVKSMSEGVVKQIENHAVWGVIVTVEQSNGLEVQYVGLAKDLNIKNGTQVKQGEIIGKTGDTNQAEILQQPHLHLGVKQGGQWIDPLSVID